MVVWDRESKKKTAFHYAALITALVIVATFQSLKISDGSLKDMVYQNIASVIGVTVGVPSNQYSLLAQQLAQKDLEISSRELELIERERQINQQYEATIFGTQKTVFYALSAMALVLLLLILLNFYLDYVREKNKGAGAKTHPGELQTKL